MQNNQSRLEGLLGTTIPLSTDIPCLKAAWIDTPIAPMIAIGDHRDLYLLTFADGQNVDKHIKRIKKLTGSFIIPGSTHSLLSVQEECSHYFNGTLKSFKTPLYLPGTAFQHSVWDALRKIPYGKVISYAGLAGSINKPTAHRAVGNANHVNPFCIIIPCHRVVYAGGGLGGYAGGLERKLWLLQHERSQARA